MTVPGAEDDGPPRVPGGSTWRPFLEAVLVLGVTFPLATGLRVSTLWLLAPVAVLTVARRPLESYGFARGRVGPLSLHLGLVGGIFVPYALAHWLWATWATGASFTPRLPPAAAWLALEEVLLVALPEEAFFRGYFQTQCDRAWPPRWRVLGAVCGPGLVVAAAVFALCHVPFGGPARLAVFFPGLLYGWLRARTGSIVLPTAYHAASNLLARTLAVSLVA